MKIKLLSENAKLPTRGTDFSAGLDLYACISENVKIKPSERVVIPTGIAVELPENTAGMIYTRSGLGIKFGIHVTNGVGVIDEDYRGEIRVGLHNLSQETYIIKPHERVAQMVVTPVLYEEIEVCDDLDETVRGDGGFGSTGKL